MLSNLETRVDFGKLQMRVKPVNEVWFTYQ